jgi:hypothetical protein
MYRRFLKPSKKAWLESRLSALCTHRPRDAVGKAPKGNELETALGELIVSGGQLMAARTNRRRTFARTYRNLNTLMIGAETGLLVNKPWKTVTAV